MDLSGSLRGQICSRRIRFRTEQLVRKWGDLNAFHVRRRVVVGELHYIGQDLEGLSATSIAANEGEKTYLRTRNSCDTPIGVVGTIIRICALGVRSAGSIGEA